MENQPKFCKAGIHDLNDPFHVRTNVNGSRVCRICDNARKKRNKSFRKDKQNYCRGCKVPLTVGKTWAFCTTACEKKYRATNYLYSNEKESYRNSILLNLYMQLDRASMSWERNDIKEKIKEVIASQKI